MITTYKNPIFIFWKQCSENKKKQLLNRPINKNLQNIHINVKKIIDTVHKYRDQALIKFNLDLDNTHTSNLQLTPETIQNSGNEISEEIKKAINISIKNITKFHQAQFSTEIKLETIPGVHCQQIIRPIDTIGLYIPGGSTPLPSTVMMLGIPAHIAGCKNVILCSPPPIPNIVIYTAKLCGIKKIFQVGGSQAIAAMGFGTESIPKVDKIFGPGNVWVTEAKRQINCRTNGTDIDMLAGPSEVLIIADHTANPVFIAADLLSQAEHSIDSHVILVTDNLEIAQKTYNELHKQLQCLPRNKIIHQSLKNSNIIIAQNITECFTISNQYSPEHLIMQIENASSALKYITNAGSIFLGHWTPETAGDYSSGTNHVLPTYGQSRTKSGLGVTDFQKRIFVQQLTKQGLLSLSSTIQTLTKIEQLQGHEYSITHRIRYLKERNEYTESS